MPHICRTAGATTAEAIGTGWVEGALSGDQPDLPFSFVYGGRQSKDFLANWGVSRKTRVMDSTRTSHEITFSDPETGLEVIFEAVEYSDFPAVEWLLHFRNASDKSTPILEEIRALDMDLECGQDGAFMLHHNRGSFCNKADYAPLHDLLGPCSSKKLSCVGGRSASGGDHLDRKDGSYPFFNVEFDNGGVIYGIGWSGQWAAQFERDDRNGLHIMAGMEHTHFTLYAGEKVRTPRILMFFWKAAIQDDDQKTVGSDGAFVALASRAELNDALNAFKRLLLAHHTPLKDGEPVQVPISIVSWWGQDYGSGASEQNQIDMVRTYAENGIPVECYWLDAGWFGEHDKNWTENVGNWYPKKEHFPRGLKPVADEARAHGLGFILWFEPERVAPGTRLFTEHPEWIIPPGKALLRKLMPIMKHIGGEHKVDGLLDIGIPEAFHWLVDYLSSAITENGVTIYRQDCNAEPLYYWQDNDTPDRQGITEMRYIESLYALWDELLRRHPGLVIDNVASGSRRTDLETISRCITMTRSDYMREPEGIQSQTFGINQYCTANVAGCLSFDPYVARSCYSSGIVFDITPSEGNFNAEEARKRVGEMQLLRPLYYGDFYPLTEHSIESDVWVAYQLNRRDLRRGAILVFRRAMSPYTTAQFTLSGLSPDGKYVLTDIDSGIKSSQSGQSLMEDGVQVTMESAPRSSIITYEESV